MSNQALDFFNNKKIITFDSTSHINQRRILIKNLVNKLLSTGHPVLAVSQLNAEATKKYIQLLPIRLRKRVTALSQLSTYLEITPVLRAVYNKLNYNPHYEQILNGTIDLATEILNKMIEPLLAEGFIIIFDRSPYSSLAYTSARLSIKNSSETETALEKFNPLCSFFMASQPKGDFEDNRNLEIDSWFEQYYLRNKDKKNIVFLKGPVKELSDLVYQEVCKKLNL